MKEEIDYAIAKELTWKKVLNTCDRDSYCEETGFDYKLTLPVYKAYQALVNALIDYQRNK